MRRRPTKCTGGGMRAMHRALGGPDDELFPQRFAGILMVAGAALTAILAALFGPTTTTQLERATGIEPA